MLSLMLYPLTAALGILLSGSVQMMNEIVVYPNGSGNVTTCLTAPLSSF